MLRKNKDLWQNQTTVEMRILHDDASPIRFLFLLLAKSHSSASGVDFLFQMFLVEIIFQFFTPTAGEVKMYRLLSLLLCSALVAPSLGRISELELRKERRGYIVVSSFGLLQGGSISVKWKNVRSTLFRKLYKREVILGRVIRSVVHMPALRFRRPWFNFGLPGFG